MAAYAAVVSLHHTVNALLNSSPSCVSSIREIFESAHEETSTLLKVLESLNGGNMSRSSMERVDALEAQIRDSTHKLEDVLEFPELKQQEEEEEDGDEEGVLRQEICSFGEAAKRLGEEYLAELSKEDDEDDDDDNYHDEDTTHTDFGVEMIGRSDLFNTILKTDVLYRMRPDDRYIYPFLGEEGSGSRIVVKTIFEYASNAGKFECSGWARVGGKGYEVKHVLTSLIAQVEVDVDDESLVDATEDQLSKYLYKALDNRSYMIVLDGVEDVELLDYLCNKSFPDQGNGSLVLVTTTSMENAQSGDVWRNFVLNDTHEEDTWLLLRYEIFGWESIPTELEVARKEIVHNTGLRVLSLPKTIVFLAESDKRVEEWSELAVDKGNPIFTVADEISEISELRKELRYYKIRVGQLALGFVHFPSQTERAYSRIYPERYFTRTQIIAFFGMAGIGKTNFARNIFNDDSTLNHFDHHVWIHIGPRYQTKDILLDILAQIYPDIPKLLMKEDKNLVGDFCAQVSTERCLIVLDDLYSQGPLHHLRETFTEIKGTILVTTRLPKVAEFEGDDTTIEMQLLDEEQSFHTYKYRVITPFQGSQLFAHALFHSYSALYFLKPEQPESFLKDFHSLIISIYILLGEKGDSQQLKPKV